MTLKTDFNVEPYFDDHDDTKNYHQVMFKPSKQVHSRELNQLQRILQEQIERFGETVLEKGSIVKGGNFYDYTSIPYVKIKDSNINNQPIIIGNYDGTKLIGKSSGVEALVLTSIAGYESKSPDLNTLYMKYTKTGSDALGNDVKRFIPGEILEGYKNGIRAPELDIEVVTYGVDSNPLGFGYAVSCGDGILFQKGFFTKFDNQIVVVEKYNNSPTGKVVGFRTDESIITHNADTSLRDNAYGSPNYNAPGADRVKLTPTLVVMHLEDAELDPDFMAIQEYENGLIKTKKTDIVFSGAVYEELQKRTFEESGNYTVSGHMPTIVKSPGISDRPVVVIPSGTSYVNGKRVETTNNIYLDIEGTANDSGYITENVAAEMGNYVIASFLKGIFLLNTPTTVDLKDEVQPNGSSNSGSTIGTCYVNMFKRNDVGNFEIYISGIKMNAGKSFSQTKSLRMGTSGYANLVLEGGKAVLKDSNKQGFMFPLGNSAVNNMALEYKFEGVARFSYSLTGDGVITITLGANEEFPYEPGLVPTSKLTEILVGGSAFTPTAIPASATVSPDKKTITLDITNVGTPSGSSASITLPVLRNSTFAGKVSNILYVRQDMSNCIKTDPIYLGFSDVLKVVGIYKGSNLTFTETTPGVVDVTKHFDFNRNDDVNFYKTSYIKPKSSINLLDTDRLLIKMVVLRRTHNAPYGIGAFSPASYPIDDISPILPSNKIRSSDLSLDVRSSIDVRPIINNVASIATTPSGASIGTFASPLKGNVLNSYGMTNNVSQIAYPGKNYIINYAYNLPRYDAIVLDEMGHFTIVRGFPSENPKMPSIDPKSLLIGELYVPAAPALLPAEAERIGMPEHGLRISIRSNKRYTMKDISNIEERVDNIEYYTLLSTLEMDAESMVIKGSDGLNRFKNGIFVENFDSMLACHLGNENFSASVEPSESALYPRFRAYNLDLKADSMSNVILNNNSVASLTKKDIIFEQQRFATKYRSCVTDFYKFDSTGYVYPEYDNGYEETVAPSMNLTVDMAGAFAEYSENINEIIPVKTTNNSAIVKTGSSVKTNTNTNTTSSVSGRTTTTTSTTTTTTATTSNFKTTNTTTTQAGKVVMVGTETTKKKVGDFITDIQFSPYLRSTLLRVAFFGVRPNTRFWAWFDGVKVDAHCAPAVMESDDVSKIKRIGKFGDPLKSNANGELFVVYQIPKGKFYVGDREFIVFDVDNLNSSDSATSSGVVTYRGFNFSVEKTGLEVSTRTPVFDAKITTSTKKTVITSSKTNVNTDTSVNITSETAEPAPVITRRRRGLFGGSDNDGGHDPISQTFTIDNTMTDKDSVMLSIASVAFKKKSNSLGVTLQIRKTDNGYPSDEILPFASVRLPSSNVKVSDNGTVFTDFKFKSPVTLARGESYAIVVIPDGNSPDYQVFCSKVGESDLRNGVKVTTDTSSGTLFTSTNNMAWTPYQDENMTYILTREEYTSDNGKITLRLEDYEFFDLESYIGTFLRGEILFKINPFATGTVSTISGSNTVSGSNVDFKTIFKAGDQIAIYNTIDDTYDVANIVSVNSSNSLTLDEFMTDNMNGRKFFKTVTGKVDYFNGREPARLFVKNSTAKIGNVFADGNAVRGERSNAQAIIKDVMYLPVSHYQANIYRSNFTGTSTNLSLSRQANSNGSLSSPNLPQSFDENNRLVNMDTVIKSRSLELSENSGVKSFLLTINMGATGQAPKTVSPVIDCDISGITVYEYFVNDYTDELGESEKNDGGLSETRYISKPITLRNGFDAEDLKVWLTAYKPIGTEINVYIKFQSSIDETPIEEMVWTKMELSDNKAYRSATTNLNDYKEFEYNIPQTVSGPNGGAFIIDENFAYVDAEGGLHENFKTFIVKIVMNSKTKNIVPKVKDIRAIALT